MKKNIDKECICCKRLYSKSCEGVENRRRVEINSSNSCSGYLSVGSEADCYGDIELYDCICNLVKLIGIKDLKEETNELK